MKGISKIPGVAYHPIWELPANKDQVVLAIEAGGEGDNYSSGFLLADPSLHRFRGRIVRIAGQIITIHVESTSSPTLTAIGIIAIATGQALAIISLDYTVRVGDNLDLKSLEITGWTVIENR